MNLPEQVLCMIFSSLTTEELVEKVGVLSHKIRAMIANSPYSELITNQRVVWLKRINPEKMQFLLSLLSKVYIMPQVELEEVPSPISRPIIHQTVLNRSLKEMKIYGAETIDFSKIIFMSLAKLACLNSSTVVLNP